MFGYEYPPSKYIRQFEPLQENTHFFAVGYAKVDGADVECEFEVAYTHDCRVIVIGYFSPEVERQVFGQPYQEGNITLYLPKSVACTGIVGIDRRYGLEIEIHNPFLTRSPEPMFDSPAVFVASRFVVNFSKGFGFTSDVREGNLTFALTGIDYPIAIPFPVKLVKNPELELRITAPSGSRQYDNQALAELLIPDKTSIPSWSHENVADLFCSLMSIAIGQDVQWTTYYHPHEAGTRVIWQARRKVFGKQSTYAFIDNSHLYLQNWKTSTFITKAFNTIISTSITADSALDYARAIRHFIEYRMITSRVEDQARLITTTIEELLSDWERHTHKIPSAVISTSEAKRLWPMIHQKMKETADQYIDHASDAECKNKFGLIINRTRTFFEDDILRPGFGKRLRLFFSPTSHETQIPVPIEFKKRLDNFVDTRNKVVHEGKFSPTQADDGRLQYLNALMILPLMIFAIFAYDGPYIDLYRNVKGSGVQKTDSKM